MERTKYQSRVEEALTIGRRNRQDQVRLMFLFKEAESAGCLEQFCRDVGYTENGAKNYLSAYDEFAAEGVVPTELTDADVDVSPVIYEMWGEFFDPTLHSERYQGLDREAIKKAADELGLRGYTKAYDIAKNPRSMRAAIMGDDKAAAAAFAAIAARAADDPLIRQMLQDTAAAMWHEEMTAPREPMTEHERCHKVLDRLQSVTNTAYEMDVPSEMLDMTIGCVSGAVERLENTLTVLRGRVALDDMK